MASSEEVRAYHVRMTPVGKVAWVAPQAGSGHAPAWWGAPPTRRNCRVRPRPSQARLGGRALALLLSGREGLTDDHAVPPAPTSPISSKRHCRQKFSKALAQGERNTTRFGSPARSGSHLRSRLFGRTDRRQGRTRRPPLVRRLRSPASQWRSNRPITATIRGGDLEPGNWGDRGPVREDDS